MNKILIISILLILISFSNCGEDYYRLLGVRRDASKEEIRRAFKKLSLKYHPDKNKNKKNPEKAKEMFIKIANAYEVLNDDKLRQIYDKHGEEGVKQHQQHGGNFNDIFNFFFHGGMGGGFHQNFQEGPEKNYFENTDVLFLKMENLSKLLNRRKIWFVYFFKSNNEGFQETKQKIIDISSQTYGIFNFGAVNCKDDEEICEDYSVFSTPKIMYFPDSGSDEEEYKGPLEFQSILKYGARLMQNFVRVINKDNYNDFLTSHSERYHVLLFTSRKTTPPLFKALSKDYLNHLNFGEIRQSESELIKSFNVNKFPTLMVIKEAESNEVDIFKEELKYDTIKKFLNKYAYKKKQENKNIKVRELNTNTFFDNNVKAFLVCDIEGDNDKLKQTLDIIKISLEQFIERQKVYIVFLGDLISYDDKKLGEGGKEKNYDCIRQIMEFKEDYLQGERQNVELVLLKGNHDIVIEREISCEVKTFNYFFGEIIDERIIGDYFRSCLFSFSIDNINFEHSIRGIEEMLLKNVSKRLKSQNLNEPDLKCSLELLTIVKERMEEVENQNINLYVSAHDQIVLHYHHWEEEYILVDNSKDATAIPLFILKKNSNKFECFDSNYTQINHYSIKKNNQIDYPTKRKLITFNKKTSNLKLEQRKLEFNKTILDKVKLMQQSNDNNTLKSIHQTLNIIKQKIQKKKKLSCKK